PASVCESSHEAISRHFRRVLLRSPERLATLNAPASLSEIYCRKRGHRATRTQRVNCQRDDEKENKIPLPERNLFAHGPADRTCSQNCTAIKRETFAQPAYVCKEGPSREYTDEREEVEEAG